MKVLGHPMIETIIMVPEVPPSLNHTNRSPWPYRKAKEHWQAILAQAVRDSGMQPCERVEVEGLMTFGFRRTRDQGNFRFMVEKALGDALVQVGILVDDTWDRYEFGNLAAAYEKNRPSTRLVLLPS